MSNTIGPYIIASISVEWKWAISKFIQVCLKYYTIETYAVSGSFLLILLFSVLMLI